MNSALNFYSLNKKIFSISGYSIPLKVNSNYDVFVLPRISSWGWATWVDRWEKADWEINNFYELSENKLFKLKFNIGGSDLYQMLKKQKVGMIDSWAIRWCYSQFINNCLTVYPFVSKIQNIGFGKSATNSFVYNRYVTTIDNENSQEFNFDDNVEINPNLLIQFQSFFSLKSRFYGRMKTYLFKSKLLKNN